MQDLGRSPKQVIVALGYRGGDADNPGVQIIHQGKHKSLSDHEKRLLKRRQAIEPLIGHTKADHRMDRCWPQGAVGDALQSWRQDTPFRVRSTASAVDGRVQRLQVHGMTKLGEHQDVRLAVSRGVRETSL